MSENAHAVPQPSITVSPPHPGWGARPGRAAAPRASGSRLH
jgi:hypothetical protein